MIFLMEWTLLMNVIKQTGMYFLNLRCPIGVLRQNQKNMYYKANNKASLTTIINQLNQCGYNEPTGIYILTGKVFNARGCISDPNPGDIIYKGLDPDIDDPFLLTEYMTCVNAILKKLGKVLYMESTPSGRTHLLYKFVYTGKVKNKTYEIYHKLCKMKSISRKKEGTNITIAEDKLDPFKIEFFDHNHNIHVAPTITEKGCYVNINPSVNVGDTAILTEEEENLIKRFSKNFAHLYNMRSLEKIHNTTHKNVKSCSGVYKDHKDYKEWKKRIKNNFNIQIASLDTIIRNKYSFDDLNKKFNMEILIDTKDDDSCYMMSLGCNDGTNPRASIYRNDDKYVIYDTLNNNPILWPLVPYLIVFGSKKAHEKLTTLATEYGKRFIEANKKIILDPHNPNCKTKIKEIEISTVHMNPFVTGQISSNIRDAWKNTTNNTPTVILTGHTGLGKTHMINRWQLVGAKIDMSFPLKSQVIQNEVDISKLGMELNKKTDHIHHLYGRKKQVKSHYEHDDCLISTMDKNITFVKKMPRPCDDHIVDIDEIHALVDYEGFKKEAVTATYEKSRTAKVILGMSASPIYLNYSNVDMLIKVVKNNRPTKTMYRINYGEKGLNKMLNFAFENHTQGKTDVFLIDNTRDIEICLKAAEKREHTARIITGKFHNSTGKYAVEPRYDIHRECLNIIEQESVIKTKRGTVVDFLFATSVMVSGLNVNNRNIGNIFIYDSKATTNYIQFEGRFRNGYDNYYCFCSNSNIIKKWEDDRTRYYLIGQNMCAAEDQAENYKTIPNPNDPKLWMGSAGRDYLNKDGTINELSVLRYIAQDEVMRINTDEDYASTILEDNTYDWNFKIVTLDIDGAENDILKNPKNIYNDEQEADREIASAHLNSEQIVEFKAETILAYLTSLKNKHNFHKLMTSCADILSQSGKMNNVKNINMINYGYRQVMIAETRKKEMFKVCVGLSIGVDDINRFSSLNFSKIELKSILETHHNISLTNDIYLGPFTEISRNDSLEKRKEKIEWIIDQFDKANRGIRQDMAYRRWKFIKAVALPIIRKSAGFDGLITAEALHHINNKLFGHPKVNCRFKTNNNSLRYLVAGFRTVCRINDNSVKEEADNEDTNIHYVADTASPEPEKKKLKKIELYVIGEDWTIDNCHGFKTNSQSIESNIDRWDMSTIS